MLIHVVSSFYLIQLKLLLLFFQTGYPFRPEEPNMYLHKTIEKYIEQGLKPIPVRFKSKKPFNVDWNGNWDAKSTLTTFKGGDDLNVGILLGDIVDVEGDTDDANVFLNSTLDKYDHPIFKSYKSYHHLFKNPFPGLTRTTVSGIEFRANKHQSLLPPSIHPNGTSYTWVREITSNIPYLPEELIDILVKQNCLLNKSVKVAIEHPYCYSCRKQFKIHKTRFDKELKAFKSLDKKWKCNRCRESIIKTQVKRVQHKATLPIRIEMKCDDPKRMMLIKSASKGHRCLIQAMESLRKYYGSILKAKEFKPFIGSQILDSFYINLFLYNFRCCIMIKDQNNESVVDKYRNKLLLNNKMDIIYATEKELTTELPSVLQRVIDCCLSQKSHYSNLLKSKLSDLPPLSLDLFHI